MRIALLMKLGAATAGGLIALACAWTLVCVIAFTRVLEGVERRHGRSFDEAHPGWASRNGEARIGGANGANPRPRRVGPFDGDDDGDDDGGDDGGPDGALATDSSGDCYPTCDPDAARRLDYWLGHQGFRDAMAGPPILPRWEEFLAEQGPATHVMGGPDFHGEWESPPDPMDVLNHWLGHTSFEAAMRGDLDGMEFDPHRRVWVREGGWMAGGRRAGSKPEGEWTVAARENARGGDPNVLARMDEAVREYERSHDRSVEEPARTAPPDESSSQLSSHPPGSDETKKGHHERRRERRTGHKGKGPPAPFAGRIRVVIAATPTRREHLTKALLPALAAESESEPPIEVVVSTSDTQLCGLLEADGAPMTRCVTHRGRVGAPLTPSERDFVKRIPGDSRSRFEWYWRETVDTAVALVTSDTAVEPAMTLFLEDDVVPTKAWETKLRRLIAPYSSSVDGRTCEFDVFVLYAEGLVQVDDGERGRFAANTQAMLFCPGMATRFAELMLDRLGDAPPDWLVRDISASPVDDGDEPDDGAVGTPPRAHVIRFANPPLFQHGCEHSTLREKAGEAGANVRAMSTHRSRSFREPAIGCVRHARQGGGGA